MMKKKQMIWMLLGLLLAVLIVLGSVLIKQMDDDEKLPPVKVTEPSGESEQVVPTGPSSEQEEASSTGPSESSETEGSTQESSEETSQESVTPPTVPPTTPSTSDSNADIQAQIDALIAEIYALRDYYIAQLSYLEGSARAQYDALPPEERTPEKKQQIAFSCIDTAYALEGECDGRMDAICSELSRLLLESDGDLNLVNRVRYTYASEKERAKSEFLAKYAEYFG